MEIKILKPTLFKSKTLKINDIIEVENNIGNRWVKHKIGEVFIQEKIVDAITDIKEILNNAEIEQKPKKTKKEVIEKVKPIIKEVVIDGISNICD